VGRRRRREGRRRRGREGGSDKIKRVLTMLHHEELLALQGGALAWEWVELRSYVCTADPS
jgi:hypothetical protein